MRLVTRSDFDGLVCGALLKEAGVIDHWKFAHPKDLQDGLLEITEDDCLANVPFVEGCGLWFDHHSSEFERLELEGKYKGESRLAPSCARIIYEYYGGNERFSHFNEMMEAVDKVDSGHLTIDEIQNPKGWILIGFLMDPRTGLGRWRNFTISNYQLMERLIDACRTMDTAEILNLPDVKERIDVYFEQTEKFKAMIARRHKSGPRRHYLRSARGRSHLHRQPFPDLQHVSGAEHLRMDRQWKGRHRLLGRSRIQHFKPYRLFDVGSLMLKYGGGGRQERRHLPVWR